MENSTPTAKKTSDLNILAFWKSQQKPWKITVIRTSLERLGYKMLLPYLSLYIILMGATKTQLGLVTSAGLICTALMGPALGNFIDTKGPKKAYLFGICVLIGSYLALGGASCASICGNCLASCDRAKGMLVCESLAAGLLGMVGPMFSGWFLVNIMKVEGTPTDPETIRPLFFIAVGITIVSLLLVIFKLENLHWGGGAKKEKRSVLKDGIAILKADKNCRKWVLCAAISNVPYTMIVPYVQVFAAEVKGASVEELAAIATATALTSVICGYFVGILSDRYGRKKTLLATIALYMLGIVVLLTVKSSYAMFIFVGLMSGFQEIGAPVSGAIQNELVPRQIMGRWQGVSRFFVSLFGAFLAAMAGIIYDGLGGQWVFIIYLACEVFLRIPLLLSLPETLNYKVDESKFADVMD